MPNPLAPLRRALPAFLPRRVLLALRRNLTIGNLTERLGSVYGDRVAFRLDEKSALSRKKEMAFADVDRVVTRLAIERKNAEMMRTQSRQKTPRRAKAVPT